MAQAGTPAGQMRSVAADAVGGLFAVGVVPVVAAEYRGRRQTRRRAERTAEGVGRGVLVLARNAGADHDRGGGDGAASRPHRLAAAAQVEFEGDAAGIDEPGGEGGAAGGHADAVQAAAPMDQHVPGHRPLGDQAAPFQIAVAAFPGVAEHLAVRHRVSPAQAHGADRRPRDHDGQPIAAREADGDATRTAFIAGAAGRQPPLAAVDQDEVGEAEAAGGIHAGILGRGRRLSGRRALFD